MQKGTETQTMDILKYNRDSWDAQVLKNNKWTIPVSGEDIDAARNGVFSIVLTPHKAVPKDWFPRLELQKTLCLAGGGGQQGPILAAAGAQVTVFDNSPGQLQQDRKIADQYGLDLTTVQGDMRDLSEFNDEFFDFIFHPCSNSFVPEILTVWKEAFRVLKPGGTMISGMCNPVVYIFDYQQYLAGKFVVRHSIPYSDLHSLSSSERDQLIADGEPMCFGHSLQDQIGGQTSAGFQIIGFYEDYWGNDRENLLDKIIPGFFATRSLKPA
jgi:SAM-dependent methyltransferase